MDIVFPTKASQLAQFLGARIYGDGEAPISRLAALAECQSGRLSFCDQKSLLRATNTAGGVVLVNEETLDPSLPFTFLLVEKPKVAFARVAQRFSKHPHARGVSPQALIDPSATLGPGVSVDAFATIGPGVVIGAGTHVMAYAYIGENVQVGEHCKLFPQVVLLPHVQIKNRVHILTGSVIGSDGFGFVDTENGKVAVPQIGGVVIEDDVRIGSLVTIDRGTLGDTRVEKGVKIDNLVQIAHNCQVGEDTILCGQVGVAGSSRLGKRVVLGGQVGIGDHVSLADDVAIAAQGGTTSDINASGKYYGTPAQPLQIGLRQVAMLKKLPALVKQLKKFERYFNERDKRE